MIKLKWKSKLVEETKNISESNHSRNGLIAVFSMRDKEELKDDEEKARTTFSESSAIYKIWLHYLSVIKTFWFFLISAETIVISIITIALTCFNYFYYLDEKVSGTLDWVLLGFALVTPLSISIRLVFVRREAALNSLVDFKNTALHYYLSHTTWDRKIDDRKVLLEKSDKVIEALLDMGNDLSRYLTLPTVSKPVHRVTHAGREFSKEAKVVSDDIYYLMAAEKCVKLSVLTSEVIKDGLSTSEASRIRQFERLITASIEKLRIIKMYRTPQAVHVFMSTFAFLVPPYYSPSFAQVARNIDSLAFGILFALIVTLSLSALLNSIHFMEDPFVDHLTLDAINVKVELDEMLKKQLYRARATFFKDEIIANGRRDIFKNSRPGSSRNKICGRVNLGFSAGSGN